VVLPPLPLPLLLLAKPPDVALPFPFGVMRPSPEDRMASPSIRKEFCVPALAFRGKLTSDSDELSKLALGRLLLASFACCCCWCFSLRFRRYHSQDVGSWTEWLLAKEVV